MLYFGLYSNTLYYSAQIVTVLATGSSLGWLLIIPSVCGVGGRQGLLLLCFVLSTILLSGATRYSRLILSISSPGPRINHFSKKP